MDPERRRRISSEGGRSSHGGRSRGYEDEFDQDYDEDYDEDDDRNISNRYQDEDYDEDDRYDEDEDDYEDMGYEDEHDEDYDEDERRGWERGYSRSGRGGSSYGRRSNISGRGFAGMGPEERREMGRRGGQARWNEDEYDRGRGRSGSGRSNGRSSGRNSSSSNRGSSSSRSSNSGRRGFGALSREEVRRTASKGGRTSHREGRGRGGRRW
jgi:hypothetical protein